MDISRILKDLRSQKALLENEIEEVEEHISFILKNKKFTIPQIRKAAKSIDDHLLLTPEEVVDKIIEYLAKDKEHKSPSNFKAIPIKVYSAEDLMYAARMIDSEFPRTPVHFTEEIISFLYRKKKI